MIWRVLLRYLVAANFGGCCYTHQWVSAGLWGAVIATYLAAYAWDEVGLVLDHTCHNGSGCVGGATCVHRRCVNPAHLEPVTDTENQRRGEGPAAQHARVTHCPRGHEYAGGNLYIRPGGQRKCRTCNRLAEREKRVRA